MRLNGLGGVPCCAYVCHRQPAALASRSSGPDETRASPARPRKAVFAALRRWSGRCAHFPALPLHDREFTRARHVLTQGASHLGLRQPARGPPAGRRSPWPALPIHAAVFRAGRFSGWHPNLPKWSWSARWAM